MNPQQEAPRKFLFSSLLLLGFLLALALLLAVRQGVFEQRLSLRFTTNSGVGLSKGMAVKFQGFTIGQLRAVELMPDNRIVGEVEIAERHRHVATRGAVLRLGQDNLVTSELYLEPQPGSTVALRSGEEIRLDRSALAADLERRVMDKIDPALQQLQLLLTRLSDANTGLPAAVGALHQTLNQANGTLAALRQRMDDPRLDAVLTSADKVMGNLATGTERLGQTLETTQQLLGTTEKTVQTVQGAVLASQTSVQDINRALAGVLAQSRQLFTSSTELIEDFRAGGVGRFIAPRRAPAPDTGPRPSP